MDDPQEVAAPSNIVINGEEIPLEEAQKLIETGRKTREYEQKWNTTLDTVWPEYGKTREHVKALETENAQAKAQLAEFQRKQTAGTDTQVDREKARAAAKELGFVLDDDIKDKFVARDELDKYLDEREQKREAVKAVLAEADKLAKEINEGEYPVKFNKKAVLAYANQYGIGDLRKAWEDMNEDILTPWKEEQIASKKGKSLSTLKSSGIRKEPGEVKVTDDNVKESLKEALWGNS
jgi:predicted  nucleic acid-binding Zn-ribbon protein